MSKAVCKSPIVSHKILKFDKNSAAIIAILYISYLYKINSSTYDSMPNGLTFRLLNQLQGDFFCSQLVKYNSFYFHYLPCCYTHIISLVVKLTLSPLLLYSHHLPCCYTLIISLVILSLSPLLLYSHYLPCDEPFCNIQKTECDITSS